MPLDFSLPCLGAEMWAGREMVVTAGFDVGAERPARPTIAELREVTQPPSVRTRAAAEHWVAHAYLRDISPYLTRILLRAGFSANGVTWLMIIAAAAAVATTWATLLGDSRGDLGAAADAAGLLRWGGSAVAANVIATWCVPRSGGALRGRVRDCRCSRSPCHR